MPPDLPLVAQVLTQLGITTQHYRSLLERRLAPFGLTVLQLSALSHLSRQRHPRRVTDIAEAVDAGQPAISKMMVKFEAAGWVTLAQDKDDKRAKTARITEMGTLHIIQTQRAMMPDVAGALMDWGEADMTRVLHDLKRMSEVLTRPQP